MKIKYLGERPRGGFYAKIDGIRYEFIEAPSLQCDNCGRSRQGL